MTEILVTDEERKLIEQIRNYRNGKHNPSRAMRKIIIELFYRLLDD